MEAYSEYYQFVKTLMKNISISVNRNIIPSEWLSGQEGNSNRMLHGRMLWLLCKTGDALGYVVEIDCGFTPTKGRQFRPDIQLWSNNRGPAKLHFLVDYEGTNSQDYRTIWKDLQHFSDSKGSVDSPDYWIIIYTFPNHPVEKLPPWIRYEPDFTSFDEVCFKQNPHSFFKNKLNTEMANYIDQSSEWEKRKLILMNLTSTGLEIDYPKHLQTVYSF